MKKKQKTTAKGQVTLRLDHDVLDFFKSKGKGWQIRVNDVLKAIVDAIK